MAFKKILQLPSSVSGDYWRITRIEFDNMAKEARIDFSQYLSQISRNNGQAPIGKLTIYRDADNYPFSSQALANSDILAIAYVACKTSVTIPGATEADKPTEINFFVDAENV